ncbi:transcription factor Tfb4 [Meira miltonrushii]|uniref:General transcription and DNA repair factor IIH subunit TFB4 n=1 Tax=Meira miltonrushii TaxID=1280837 RepID=A0A316V938_9BASI|nr:transcription factor Tfb4 [Meira miltonrushii]PWN32981.1 transcription factor Tfb4 [Meira miltonrushii]
MTQRSSASSNAGRFTHLITSHSDADAAYIRTPPDLLGVIIDVDPAVWARKRNGLQLLRKATQDVCVFLNAHSALRHDNCCAVYAAGRTNGNLIFSNTPSLSHANSLQSSLDANTYQPFKIIDDAVMSGVQTALQDGKQDVERPPSHGIVSSLAQCLCHINRIGQLTSAASGIEEDPKSSSAGAKANAGRGYKSRILVISASPDSSSQYVAMMNCIFGAQKKGVTVDVCKILGGQDSVFLQQASHLTKGTYYRLDLVEGLLQTLMTTFLASPAIRDQMRLPSNDDVDFRAACFCHGRVVDVGYVCSVCLSIFCEPRDKCLTCRATFPKRTLQRFQEEQRTVS